MSIGNRNPHLDEWGWQWNPCEPRADFRAPLPNIRLAFTTTGATTYSWTAIHHDGQGSVRGVTSIPDPQFVNLNKAERTIYRPYSNWDASLTFSRSATIPTESHS